MRRALGLAVVLAVALCATASADVLSDPTLTLDTYFAPPSGIARTDFTAGATSSPHASATDTSLNRIYSVGETGSGTSGNVAIVARHPDGTSDTSFGVNGQVVVSVSSSVEDYGIDLLVLPDHHLRILVKTGTGSTTDGALVGLLPDGTADTAFGAGVNTVNSASLNGIVTFEGAFQAAYPGQLSNLTPETPNAFALAPDGRLAVTGDSAHGGTDDNTFVAMFNADGSLATGFGTRGTLVQDRSGNASADQGADIAFRPAGGIVVLVQLGPTTSAASALHAYTVAGADDPSFANGGDLALAVGDPPTIPAALLVYNGQLWVTGSTRTAADTNAFIARAGADGSGLQSRQFDMRGQLIDPSLAVTSAGEAMTIVPGVSGGPDTLVVAGSVTSTSSTDWAAAAFNGLDGNLADAGFGDIAIQTPGSAGLTGVSAGQGWVAITGPYQDTVTTPTSQSTYTRFGDARLLLGGGLPPVVPDPNAGKTCNLALSVTRPLELTLPWTQTAPVTFQVANNGTLACGGSISVSGSYGLTDNGVAGPIATGPVAPGTSFTSAAARLGFLGGLRPEDTATFTLAATGDTDLIDNLAALHVRFSYCDLGVAAASRPSFVPSEGTLDFSLTVRDAGTATCGGVRVAVSGAGRRATTEKAYSVDAGHDVADEVAAGVRKPVKAGSKVKMIFGVAHAGDPVASNNSVTISPRLLDVGDTNATRPAGSAATLRGAASPGRGPAKAKLLRVTRVSVAVRRLGGGCRWLASTHGGFRTKHVAAKASCAPTWLTAHGTTRWTLPTGGLPAGQYELLSRATIGAGFREDSFTTKDRNRVLFTVR